MLKKLAVTRIDDPLRWNTLVASFSFTSALQGWGLGEVKRLVGWTPYRLALERDGEVFAAAQVLARRFALGTALYVPRGPALNAVDELIDAATALRGWAGRHAVSLKIEPPVPLSANEPLPQVIGPWRYAESVQPEHTVLLDLSVGLEARLAAMHQMARRNTKTALKLGVTVEADGDFEAFWELFCETNRRSHLVQYPRAYYETVWRDCNRSGSEAAIITARFEGRALASALLVGLGSNLTYLYGGSTRLERREGERDPKASNALYWGMMRFGIERGYEHLDLFGIPRNLDGRGHAHGVYEFKERMGGERVNFPAFELALSPWAGIFSKALRWRKSAMNYFRRGTLRDVV